METLEELKAIIAGKPEGATHYSVSEQAYYKFKCECWMWCDKGKSLFSFMQDDDEVCNYLRSLSDIERIIELMETNREAKKFALLSLKEAIEPNGLINSEVGLKTIKTIQNAIDNIVRRL